MNYALEIEKLLKTHFLEEFEIKLEIPPEKNLGDFAFPCFHIAKSMKKSPQLIAHDLAAKLNGQRNDIIEKVIATGPYVNFFLQKKNMATHVLAQIQEQQDKYGSKKQEQKIMIEFSSPNTNKPLHLGHVRNISLGDSMSRVFTFLGNYTVKVCLVNDRGVHICKSMLAYKKWGHHKNPDKKSDFFVGDFYVLFAKKATEYPELENEAQEMLRQWEAGDKEVVALWKKMNQWVYEGFEQTYHKLGVSFDKYYYESDIYKYGRDIVAEGLKKKIFSHKEGAIIAPLEDVGLPDKVVIRSDRTTLYITQDIFLAQKKFLDYPIDRSIYVVASEQNLHFQQLFAILKKLGNKWATGCYHLSYGMVLLPEGKMKSREGTVVDADRILEELFALAREEIQKRHPELEKVILEKRSQQVGLGALKFHLLKIDAIKDMVYNPKESINFEGETGPYVQYTHARISSILRKANQWKKMDAANKGAVELYQEKELELVAQLERFPLVIEETASHYKPSYICRYLLDLCQLFNSYYHDVHVLNAEEDVRSARLYLLSSIKLVLQNGLSLLGIEAPEEM